MLHQTWWWHTELQEEESQVTPGVTAPAHNRDGEEGPRDTPQQGKAPAGAVPCQQHSSDSSCSVNKLRARGHRAWPMAVPPHICAFTDHTPALSLTLLQHWGTRCCTMRTHKTTEANLGLPRYLAESVNTYWTHLRHSAEASRQAQSLWATSQDALVQSRFSRILHKNKI